MLPCGKAAFFPLPLGFVVNPNSRRFLTTWLLHCSLTSTLSIDSSYIVWHYFMGLSKHLRVCIDCSPASARFGFPFEYETSELSLCRRTPRREQHVTLPTASKNESEPNCVWMPECHASIIPKQNAAKHNWNWQLQGISERKTHLKGIPWHFDS